MLLKISCRTAVRVRNYIIIITLLLLLLLCNKKATYLNPPRPARGCVFHPISYCRLKTNAIYDLVFRIYPVSLSGRTRKKSGVDCKLCVVTPCVLAGDDHYRLCLLNMVAVCSFEMLLTTFQPDCMMSQR